MELSTHKVEVVPVQLEPHPNADTLSIVKVFGYTVIVKTSEWQNIEIGAYIPPDSIVPETPQFEFLGKHKRIRAQKLRGIMSMGLLTEAPEGSKIGDNVADKLGIIHYEPPVSHFLRNCDSESGPSGIHIPVYSVDSLYRYPNIFQDDEPVLASEKIHGANARYAWHDGRLYCGSHRSWKKESDRSPWWIAIKQYPWVIQFLEDRPYFVLFGELYGDVQDLKYGCKRNELKLVFFDLYNKENGSWMPADLCQNVAIANLIPWVPMITEYYDEPYDFDKIKELAMGHSKLAHQNGVMQMREGIVIRPTFADKTHPEIGRVILKAISPDYLMRNK